MDTQTLITMEISLSLEKMDIVLAQDLNIAANIYILKSSHTYLIKIIYLMRKIVYRKASVLKQPPYFKKLDQILV